MSDEALQKWLQVPMQRRLAPLRSFNREARTVELVWTSGARVLRYDWFDGECYVEQLDMTPEAVDMTRLNSGAPVLDTHGRWRLADVLGVVESARLEGERGVATVRFSRREEVVPVMQDVEDGIVRNVSVGYEVLAMEQRGFDQESGYPIMFVTRWAPFEISLVPVGADWQAQTRGQTQELPQARTSRCLVVRQPAEIPATLQERHSMTGAAAPAAGGNAATNTEQPAAASAEEIRLVRNQAQEEERARMRDITAVGEQFGYQRLASEHVTKGTGAREFRDLVLDEIHKTNQAKVASTRDIGLNDREVKSYSILRAMRAMLAAREGKPDAWKEAGFELACHNATRDKMGAEPKNNGVFIPWDVQARMLLPTSLRQGAAQNPYMLEALVRQLMQRDLTAATDSAGGYLVATENLAGSFIELLRATAVVVQLGGRMLPGLIGDVTIPKQTAGSTAYWLATEATAITESQQTFGQLPLTPRNVGAYTEVSRQLLMQSSPAADMLVMDDLRRQVALALDLGALNGSGAAGQPTGLLNVSGIGSVSGTTLGWAGIVEFETDVAASNALAGALAYLTTPAIRGLLKTRSKQTSGVEGNFIWGGVSGDNQVNGYRGEASTQMPAATMAFGDWSQIIIGEWGVLELAFNPYANFPAGITGFRAWQSADVGIRQAGAFSVATTIT